MKSYDNVTVNIAPDGSLYLNLDAGRSPIIDASLSKKVQKEFKAAVKDGSGSVLLFLGTILLEKPLTSDLRWLREFSEYFINAFCQHAARSTGRGLAPVAPPDDTWVQKHIDALPPLPGAEYIKPGVLQSWWEAIDIALRQAGGRSPLKWLEKTQPVWRGAGRVHLHLAENKQDRDFPFAFLATYVDGVSTKGGARHISLSSAIVANSRERERQQLLSLLVPLERAASQLPWLRRLVDTGELYQPLRWTPEQALEFLSAIPLLQECGIAAFSPEWWRAGRASRPQVSLKMGNRHGSGVGFDAMLDVKFDIAVAGKRMSPQELRRKLGELEGTKGLVQMKGRWVELDASRLTSILDHWDQAQVLSQKGLPFIEAMRLLAGMESLGVIPNSAIADDTNEPAESWLQITAGPWLQKTLEKLDRPELINGGKVPGLHATLRPYQKEGVDWLRFMSTLRLGACLADDMGLGKTVQVLALLLSEKRRAAQAIAKKSAKQKTSAASRSKRQRSKSQTHSVSILVVPASIISNWQMEAARFAPGLRVAVLHRSVPGVDLKNEPEVRKVVAAADVVITSYAMVSRLPVLQSIDWQFVVLDEAQTIRNPKSGQSRSVKALKGHFHLALTGTPVENSLADLWSVFDFINPGLLGSLASFKKFIKQLDNEDESPRARYAPLRKLVSPYILRRLKTDRQVIDDLPDKTELVRYCGLSKTQVKLYRESIQSLKRELREAEGIKRRGLVLAYLMRFKQICNHPQQWLGLGEYTSQDSGKFMQLITIAETLASRQERVLVFTQFREMTRPIANILEAVYGRAGSILHGGTAVKRRQTLVNEFQENGGPPFMVLSLKAGGVGLNLTAASHVIHFDRWWNPAVENQATDRAFRIGQKHNVFVHKFVCRGTIEEKIDRMIQDKVALAGAVVDMDANTSVTEMSDKELLNWVAIDINRAAAEVGS